MASPTTLKIVPNCGLQIEIDSIVDASNYDETEPIKYHILNRGNFNLRRDFNIASNRDLFSGWMSPASEVSLPPAIKEMAGIPLNAQHYAFMHPPMGLADAIDWEDPFTSSDEFNTSPTSLRLSKYNSSTLVVNEDAMIDATFLGGFVYFDEHFDVLCVNAIALQSKSDDYFLKLSGPFSTTHAVGSTLLKKNRVHALVLDIFHEAGLSSCSYVRPDETFEDEQLSNDYGNFNGALVFFRDDGSSFAYMVDNSDTSHPKGEVEILPDIISSLPTNFRNDRPKFIFKFLDKRKIDRWCEEAHELIEENDDGDWKDDLRKTLDDPKTLLHNACLAQLDHDIISSLLKDRNEQENLSYPDKFGWLPLHYACRYHQDLRVIELFVYYYSQALHHPDPFGRYPLHTACFNRHSTPEVIQFLLKDEGHYILYKQTKRIEMTPLYIACDSEADIGVIKVLLDADTNCDTIQVKTKAGRLPLHVAVDEKMDAEIIELLLEKDEQLKGRVNYVPDIQHVRGGFLVSLLSIIFPTIAVFF